MMLPITTSVTTATLLSPSVHPVFSIDWTHARVPVAVNFTSIESGVVVSA